MEKSTQLTTDLQTVLEGLGVEIKRAHGDEITGRCPVHHKVKGRESTRYSWSINVDTGLWLCFTCGARGNLFQLVSELTDNPGDLWSVQSTLIQNGLRRLNRDEAAYEQDVREDIDWISYGKFAPLPEAILELRQITAEAAKRFGVRWDTENKAIVLPIVSPLGELKGWQLKKTGWYANVPTGVHKGSTLFGIERAFAPVALLLESPLDVVRFHTVYTGTDISAVAGFGANLSSDQQVLLESRFDQLIVALDNDKAGKAEMRRLHDRWAFRKGIKYFPYLKTDAKDIGDMTDDAILYNLDNLTRLAPQ